MKIALVGSILAAAVLAGSSVSAIPVQWTVEEGGNGHWYDFVPSWGSYSTALNAAAASEYDGMSGYLVTITSAEENAFVRGIAKFYGSSPTVYIAASDSASEGNWSWQAGPEEGENLSYTNWSRRGLASWPGANYALMDRSSGWFSGDSTYGATYVIEYSTNDMPAVPLPATGMLMFGGLGVAFVAERLMRRRRRAA
ncbi:lectin-like protein [Tropicimonas sp. IMCC34043]|uniref:lectin-like protein n=1 Tax=Tropicimonas sp. IMCC34043 TaxID=2248760 RepID=UPI000E2785EB|nr:lectin-like protein [Tropicimonas sp. IMCC34043]